MSTPYEVADMMIGVRNMIEAADLRRGDQVLLLADTRSDKTTLEALTAGLRFFGAEPMTLVTEPIARYGEVPAAVMDAMHASDVAIWVWPVFITFTPTHRALGRKREESGTQLHEARMKPYHIYFEGNAGLLAVSGSGAIAPDNRMLGYNWRTNLPNKVITNIYVKYLNKAKER